MRRNLRRWGPLATILLVAVTAGFVLRDVLTFDTLRAHADMLVALRTAHPVASAAVFVLVYVTVVVFSLPGAALASVTGGFLFGLFPGTLYNIGAATLGAVAVFLAVRLGLGDRLRHRLDTGGEGARRLSEGLRTNEVPVLLTMRLVPVVPFFLANLAAAAMGVALGRFIWTTALGIIPGGLVYTWIGAGLGEVLARGDTPDLGMIFQPQILGPLLALAALTLLPNLVRRLRKS